MDTGSRSEEPTGFDEKVREQLGFYVYRLIDPRDPENKKTFYVGKGIGNRVFEHARGEIIDDPEALLPPKRKTINEIRASGRSVEYVIHRHGLTEKVAYQVEAALIDAYPDLTNAVGGHGSDKQGLMTAREVIEEYGLPALDPDPADKLVLISIPKLKSGRDRAEIYRLVRYCWRINKSRAEKADYVLAVQRGVIRGVYVVNKWRPATPENFPELAYADGSEAHRWGFEGEEADPEVWAHYVGEYGKRIEQPKLRHDQYPIRYWNC